MKLMYDYHGSVFSTTLMFPVVGKIHVLTRPYFAALARWKSSLSPCSCERKKKKDVTRNQDKKDKPPPSRVVGYFA